MICWRLKTYLVKKHQIYSVTDLQTLIEKKTGVMVSLANLCKLVNHQPKMIRLETIEIICTALGCELSSILKVGKKAFDPEKKSKLSFKNTPKGKIALKSFPEPRDYESR